MNSIKNSVTDSGPFRRILFGMLCLALAVAAGCSKSANQAGTQTAQANTNQAVADKTQTGQLIMPTVDSKEVQPGGEPPGLKPQPANAPSRENYAQTSQEELVVGIWRYQVQSNGYTCQGEDIYQGNGSYSTQWNCGGSLTWQTGVWYLVQPGVIRRDIKDYEPKVWRGVPQPMHVKQETVQFRFIDYYHMQYVNGVVLYRQ